jgi:hypothetical protein
MARYNVTVPPTAEQGSYSTIAADGYGQTFRACALQDYNSCRAHDGLPPVSRMPAGTTYALIRSTVDSWEVQANYGFGHGWECVSTETTHKEAKERFKEYVKNEGGLLRLVLKRERVQS